MPYRQINCPSLKRRLSNIMAAPSSAPDETNNFLDQYRANGGNCIHLHGEGGETRSREETGRWLRERNFRDEFFICTAICHDDWNEQAQKPIDRFHADAVTEDIDADLHLLGVKHLDLVYISDKPGRDFKPVIDALLTEKSRGRIGAFGLSSWMAKRIIQANEYARRAGNISATAIVTTELALLKSIHPMWPEYVPFDASLRQAVLDEGMAVFAWLGDVNQGQSIFGNGDALNRMKPQWVSRWEMPANRACAKRVEELAAQRKVQPRDVNSAWVLNQDFPTIGIVNSQALMDADRNSYLTASNLALTSSERRQLESGY